MEKGKNTSKNNDLQKFRDDIIRHFDVVAEGMDKKWNLIAEQYSDITARLDKVEAELKAHSMVLVEVKFELKLIKQDIAALEPKAVNDADRKRIEFLEKRVAALEKTRR